MTTEPADRNQTQAAETVAEAAARYIAATDRQQAAGLAYRWEEYRQAGGEASLAWEGLRAAVVRWEAGKEP